jgi:hypothetical protein
MQQMTEPTETQQRVDDPSLYRWLLKWGPSIFAIASAVCAGMVWWLAQTSAQFALVRISPQRNTEAVVFPAPLYVKGVDNGVFNVRFNGLVRDDTSSDTFFLEIADLSDSRFVRQPDCCTQVVGIVAGAFQLGSRERPLHGDTEFPFRLTTGSGGVVAEGTIYCHVEPYTSTETRGFGLIGIISATLSIVQFALQLVSTWLTKSTRHNNRFINPMDGVT